MICGPPTAIAAAFLLSAFVPAPEEANQYSFDDFILADDDFADFVLYGLQALFRGGKITHNVILSKMERLCLFILHQD